MVQTSLKSAIRPIRTKSLERLFGARWSMLSVLSQLQKRLSQVGLNAVLQSEPKYLTKHWTDLPRE